MNAASTLPIEQYSVTEKLLLMERLWAELSRRPSEVPIPDWHGEILDARRKAVEKGSTSFMDWEVAKRELRERFS